MASLYKRDGKYYVKFYQDGKRVRRSLGTSKLSDARKIKEQIERELSAGKFNVEKKDTPISVFWKEYEEWARKHKRPRTIEIETLFWNQFVKFAKPKTLGSVTPRDLERFKTHKIECGNAPQSINNALRHIQAIFNYAKKLGYYNGKNPVIGIERFKLEKNPPRYLSKEEMESVLSISEKHGKNIHLVFALGLYAGLRKNEIINARWEWFDFEEGLVTLTSLGNFHLKTYESRTVPLHEQLAKILKLYREEEGYLFYPEKESSDYRYRYDFKKSFASVIKKAGLKNVSPHTLRHTFASQLAINGVSIYKISKWLGHSSITTTQIYAHLQQKDDDINRF